MNKSITNALRKPRTDIFDVSLGDGLHMGEQVFDFVRRGQRYFAPYTRAELVAGDHIAVGEGHTYVTVYFCDDTVPLDIRELLS